MNETPKSLRNVGQGLFRRMQSRDPHEPHRAATTLELLYDLCFVVAIAQAAASLHHGVAENHAGPAILGFALVFFAIWWAWMGFAWFASAFDTDDVEYRLKVLVQIVGVLVLAAGVPRALQHQDFGLITWGYVIMRVGLVAQWLRAAKQDPKFRKTALRYAAGIILVQIGWISLLALPPENWKFGWLLLAPAELLVPVWAERACPTTWHPHHIAERYGLLTIIVLGESVLAATLAIQAAVDSGHASTNLWLIIVSAPLIIFSMWWVYFLEPAHMLIDSTKNAFIWGYSHFWVFASAAAVGAGLAVNVDFATQHAPISQRAAGLALSLPVALYLLSVWFTQYRTRTGCGGKAFLLAAALTVAASFFPAAPIVIGAILSAMTAYLVMISQRNQARDGVVAG